MITTDKKTIKSGETGGGEGGRGKEFGACFERLKGGGGGGELQEFDKCEQRGMGDLNFGHFVMTQQFNVPICFILFC